MTVWKFILPVANQTTIQLPEIYQILKAGLDPTGIMCIWALVNPKVIEVDVDFCVFGTGHPIDCSNNRDLIFVDSVVQGPFVWHVFRDATKK